MAGRTQRSSLQRKSRSPWPNAAAKDLHVGIGASAFRCLAGLRSALVPCVFSEARKTAPAFTANCSEVFRLAILRISEE
jgi:hypothetical protein